MHPALGSVTEARLTQIASHTFRGYVPALGYQNARGRSPRPAAAKRCRIERGHVAHSECSGLDRANARSRIQSGRR